ncbi:MAG: dTMP kinase [Pseudomonadota bacterium]
MTEKATRPPRRGAFIVLEGIDGCGSTTQSKRLVEALCARGRDARHTCEPTAGPVGALIRSVLEKRLLDPSGAPRAFRWSTLALLFAADRLDHLDTEVLPALAAGAVVVSDRYDLSSLAYQSVTASAERDVLPWIRELNREAVRPDLTLVIDVPFEEARARRIARGGPEELFDADRLQRRLAEAYARAEELVPGDRIEHVSGVGSVDVVHQRVLESVFRALPWLTDAS